MMAAAWNKKQKKFKKINQNGKIEKKKAKYLKTIQIMVEEAWK